jgi:hypothetical protein
MAGSGLSFEDRFDRLDLDVWMPSYLPHWSSRAEAAATWAIREDGLHLTIPPTQALWCADRHAEPLRVSCIQSANRSGPVGSTDGPQPFADGLVVRQEQPTMWGYTPLFGRIEVTMRATVTARSMVAFWLAGIEDRPERCGEICVAEIFGDTISAGSAAVGIGIKAFRDPALEDDFTTVQCPLDVGAVHTYGVDWQPESLAFRLDGQVLRRLAQAPDYPMQLMIGVFDFPAKAASGPVPVAEVVISCVRGAPLE